MPIWVNKWWVKVRKSWSRLFSVVLSDRAKGNEKTLKQAICSEHKETLIYWEGDWEVRFCGVSVLENIQNLSGHNDRQSALSDWALSKVPDEVTFQSQGFWDSVRLRELWHRFSTVFKMKSDSNSSCIQMYPIIIKLMRLIR